MPFVNESSFTLSLANCSFPQTLLNYGSNLEALANLPGIKSVCISDQNVDQCIGTSAVMRLSLACTLYFTLLLPLALSEESFAGWWAAKLIVFAGLVVGCFYMPADAIDQYGQAARVFSGVFLVRLCKLSILSGALGTNSPHLQVILAVLTVDFAYNTQDWFVARMEEAEAEMGAQADFEPGLLSNKWRVFCTCLNAAFFPLISWYVYLYSARRSPPRVLVHSGGPGVRHITFCVCDE